MSYSDSRPFMSSGSDAIDVCPQFPMNNNEQFDPIFENQTPPFKRPRSSDDFRRLSLPNTPNPINRRTTNIFYKTRICPQLKTGSCRNGESCTYAHGIQELRQPPPNWQEIVGGQMGEEDNRLGFGGNWDDDQRIISKMKLCKKFCNGEGCPYGDRCNFVHEYPSKFQDDVGKFWESSAISIGTTGQPNSELSSVEANKALNSANSDAFRGNMKPVYWKTKLCVKWDTTGHCPFGDKCHFAHGQAELRAPVGRVEGEVGTSVNAALTKPSLSSNSLSQSMSANVPSVIGEGQSKKCLLKLKGPKKINRIYGDWLDDLPLLQNYTSRVES